MSASSPAAIGTLAWLLRQGQQRLATASPTPRLDAEVLLSAVLGKDRSHLYTWPEQIPGPVLRQCYEHWLERRYQGEPVAHLVGVREFYGHAFQVSPVTLIPRPETELLVETLLTRLPDDALDVLEMGTGTGAIGVSLAVARPRWQLLLTDVSSQVVQLAEQNIACLSADNARVQLSDWFSRINGCFAAIVSNPPYVAEGDPHLQQGDLCHEPQSALVAGDDGLDALRQIVSQAPRFLLDGGLLALEHGHDQGSKVADLLTERGFVSVETLTDLSGLDRVTLGVFYHDQ